MWRTREAKCLLLAYGVVAVICALLPLADHLGFEFAAALTIVSAIAAPFVGFAAMRIERSGDPDGQRPARAAAQAGLFAVAGLTVPTLLILLNGLRRPICDPIVGGLWLLVLPAPTAWLAATFGALARLVTPRLRWAITLVALVEIALVVTTATVTYLGPTVFAFDHFFGYFPGPLYDERIPFSPALLTFRAATVLWGVAAVASAGALASGDRAARRMHTSWAICLTTMLIVVSLVWGSDLHWRTSDRALRAALSGEIQLPHIVLHFPRNLPEREIEQLVRDASFDEALLERSLGVTPTHLIHIWLYRDSDQKREIFGAAGTQIAKPYRHETHINRFGYPHPSLQHELVHVMAGEFARGPWLAPGGLLGNAVLIEGFAVAYDLDDGTLTPIQEARAMRDLKIAPNLERLLGLGGFDLEASSRAYAYSGAFLRYLSSRFGIADMRRLYLTGDLATLGAPKTLIADFEHMLDTVPTDANARSSSARRNSEPSIFRRRCAREVLTITDSAWALAGNRLWEQSLAKFGEACSLQPSDPSLVEHKLAVAIRMRPNSVPRIMAIAETLWKHPNLDPSLEASSRLQVGDELWRHGDSADAHAQYVQASALPLDPATRRSTSIRLRAITDTGLAPLLKPYYTEGDVGMAQILRMSDALIRRPKDALLSYLVGRLFYQRGGDDKGAELMERADAIGLGNAELARDNLAMIVVARAHHNRCDEAERARFRLRAAGGSATEDAIAENWVARCRFAIARGWKPLQ